MNAGLHVRGLEGGYGDLKVVRSVDLAVSPGQITALLGRNGAGKTTTMRIVAGLNKVRAGQVLLDGVDISRLPPYRRVTEGLSYVQEGKRIFRKLSVEDNLILGTYALGLRGKQRDDAVERSLERFPILAERRRLAAGVLSGGQQQILAIAQALVSKPKVLLLDEPSAGLAPSIVRDIIDTLHQMRVEGLAVVLVEQAVEFALGVADTVAVLNVGSTTYTGPSHGDALRAAIDEAYLGERQSN